ncbi:hypothetical protein ACK3TF_001805 [Chlorella vulgaris]
MVHASLIVDGARTQQQLIATLTRHVKAEGPSAGKPGSSSLAEGLLGGGGGSTQLRRDAVDESRQVIAWNTAGATAGVNRGAKSRKPLLVSASGLWSPGRIRPVSIGARQSGQRRPQAAAHSWCSRWPHPIETTSEEAARGSRHTQQSSAGMGASLMRDLCLPGKMRARVAGWHETERRRYFDQHVAFASVIRPALPDHSTSRLVAPGPTKSTLLPVQVPGAAVALAMQHDAQSPTQAPTAIRASRDLQGHLVRMQKIFGDLEQVVSQTPSRRRATDPGGSAAAGSPALVTAAPPLALPQRQQPACSSLPGLPTRPAIQQPPRQKHCSAGSSVDAAGSSTCRAVPPQESYDGLVSRMFQQRYCPLQMGLTQQQQQQQGSRMEQQQQEQQQQQQGSRMDEQKHTHTLVQQGPQCGTPAGGIVCGGSGGDSSVASTTSYVSEEGDEVLFASPGKAAHPQQAAALHQDTCSLTQAAAVVAAAAEPGSGEPAAAPCPAANPLASQEVGSVPEAQALPAASRQPAAAAAAAGSMPCGDGQQLAPRELSLPLLLLPAASERGAAAPCASTGASGSSSVRESLGCIASEHAEQQQQQPQDQQQIQQQQQQQRPSCCSPAGLKPLRLAFEQAAAAASPAAERRSGQESILCTSAIKTAMAAGTGADDSTAAAATAVAVSSCGTAASVVASYFDAAPVRGLASAMPQLVHAPPPAAAPAATARSAGSLALATGATAKEDCTDDKEPLLQVAAANAEPPAAGCESIAASLASSKKALPAEGSGRAQALLRLKQRRQQPRPGLCPQTDGEQQRAQQQQAQQQEQEQQGGCQQQQQQEQERHHQQQQAQQQEQQAQEHQQERDVAVALPRPFLRRRSSTLPMQKLPDWNQVRPRTSSRWNEPHGPGGGSSGVNADAELIGCPARAATPAVLVEQLPAERHQILAWQEHTMQHSGNTARRASSGWLADGAADRGAASCALLPAGSRKSTAAAASGRPGKQTPAGLQQQQQQQGQRRPLTPSTNQQQTQQQHRTARTTPFAPRPSSSREGSSRLWSSGAGSAGGLAAQQHHVQTGSQQRPRGTPLYDASSLLPLALSGTRKASLVSGGSSVGALSRADHHHQPRSVRQGTAAGSSRGGGSAGGQLVAAGGGSGLGPAGRGAAADCGPLDDLLVQVDRMLLHVERAIS